MNVTSAVIVLTGLLALFGPRRRPKLQQSLHLDGRERLPRKGRTRQDGSVSVCPGKGRPDRGLTEADVRQTVSVGRNPKAAENEPAASQSFRPFNSTTNTVEWRIANGKPFAIIQRWHIADNEDRTSTAVRSARASWW